MNINKEDKNCFDLWLPFHCWFGERIDAPKIVVFFTAIFQFFMTPCLLWVFFAIG